MKVYTRVDGFLAVFESSAEDYVQAQIEVAEVMEELWERGPILVLIEGGKQ